MEAGDIIRKRVEDRSERIAQQNVEQKESEIARFNEKVQQIAEAIVATNYAGCSIYEWEGNEHVGIELYEDRHSEHGREMQGILLHLLIDSDNNYRVILESSVSPEKPSYSYRIDYEGGVNVLEGTQFDPRTYTPSSASHNYALLDFNMYRMDELLKSFKQIQEHGPYTNDEAWYRI